jgi:Leucine-rich repeat (LRR) protein
MKKAIVFWGFVLEVLWFVLSTSLPLQGAIPASERAALIALYNATNGDNWTDNGGWKTPPLYSDGFAMPGTEYNWSGISISIIYVRSIQMSSNQLSGSIPPELGNLSNLEELYLPSNQLSGSIPPELGNLSHLAYLSLRENQLSGSIPPELGNLSNLEELCLPSNQLSGSIPPELGNLSNLKELTLANNQLSGSIPPKLQNLTNLRNLSLDQNQLSGSIPPELGNLSHLGCLSLEVNQLSGSIPSELGNLSYLMYLNLSSNQLSGSIPPELGNLNDLVYLSLHFNQLSGSIPPELGNLKNLWLLCLNSNQLTGCIPSDLGNLSNLNYLTLEKNQLSGSIPPELGNLDKLENLYLSSNQLSGRIPPELGNLSNLEALLMSSNQLSGSIPPELGNLSNLDWLYLDNNQLSGNIPLELGNLNNLLHLDLSSNQLSGSIPSELGNLINLDHLFLFNNQLSGSIPPELGNLSNLAYLSLRENHLSGSIPPELGNLSNLLYLNFYSNQLSGSIPPELGNLSYLKLLELSDNRLSGNIPTSLTNLTNLEYLSIRNNCLYTDDPDLKAWLNSFETGWESFQCAGEKNLPFGSFDTPIDGSTVYSSIPVTGWALDDSGIDSVKIYREQGNTLVYIGDGVFVEGARPDVAAAYPGYTNNTKAGWGYMMLTNFLPNSGNGTFVIHAVATDVVGKTTTLGTKTIHCDNAHAVKPFGAIDTPTQGGTASGSNFINWGWVLTPQPNHIATDGSTINVYVDGVDLGHPNYNLYRSDIATLFPGYANSNGASGYFYLNTTAYVNGVHTIQWTARDSSGKMDGIGSRYFSITNTGNFGLSRHVNPEKSGSQTPIPDFSKITHIPVDHPVMLGVKKGFEKDTELQLVYSDDFGISRINIKETDRVQIYLTLPDENNDNTTAPLLNSSSFSGYQVVNHRLKPLPVGSTLDTHRGIFYWQPGPGFIGKYRFVFIEKIQNRDISRKNIMVKIVPRFE